MPSNIHPQAMFDPIPPDLDLSALVEKTPNFDYVIRISTDQISELGLPEFEKLVLLHVIQGGKPLVVEGWEGDLPPWLYSSTWMQDNMGKKQEQVRDIPNQTNIPMTIGHYLSSLEKLTRQWTPTNFRDPKRQRLYLKDIDCPDAWDQQLREYIPEVLQYLNNCIGEKGGPGSVHEKDKYNHLVLGRGIGPAGDLMSNLPPEMRAQNMMCYIGHEGTYTPAHREMCATLGQNIMVETSEVGKGEKPGSSIWFMTETKDREVVSEYFLSMLGHDIEVENHFAQIVAWKKAPFPVYIVEQKVGDFILIPPLAPHQVWNRGTRTMKVAWNRTTVETLEMALYEALPRARMVCRDEQYKCKAIVFYSLMKYYGELQKAEKEEEGGFRGYQAEPVRFAPRVRQLQRDFKRLFGLYKMILVSEMFSPDLPKEKNIEYVPFDSNITCSYCRCNIFNRFLTCKTCVGELANEEEDTYDICMDCYVMGRSCACLSNLQWVEQWRWPELTKRYDLWRGMVLYIDGLVDNTSPQPLDVERKLSGKKSIAHICQEQLKKRPWRDITKPQASELFPGESDEEPEVDDEGRPKRKAANKRRSQKKNRSSSACHICKKKEANWKLATCTTCSASYCYGTLWRAFDMKPEKVMEALDWQCPKCLKICSCGACRRLNSKQVPYQPKGTLLGHDTRRVADPRSVESLVDFSRTNLAWLKEDEDIAPQNSVRMKKLLDKAQAEKSRDEVLEDDSGYDHHGEMDITEPLGDESLTEHAAIDPALRPDRDHESGTTTGTPTAVLPEGATVSHNTLASTINGYDMNNEAQHATPAFVSPTDLLTETNHSEYPDEPVMPRERMMGIGYYKQRNDADKILFDAPDTSTPGEESQSIPYPRLQSDSDDGLLVIPNKKRQRESIPSSKRRLDEAHVKFIAAQKKQKLSDAKRDGKYFMTKNILEGGKTLKVKLSLANHKEFLTRLERFDEEETAPRHNQRPQRTSIAKKDVIELDSTVVIPDVRNEGRDIIDDENSDEEIEINTIVPIRRAHRVSAASVPVNLSLNGDLGDEVAVPPQRKPRGRPPVAPKNTTISPNTPKRGPGRPRKSDGMEHSLPPNGTSTPGTRGLGRLRKSTSLGGEQVTKRPRSPFEVEAEAEAARPEKRRRESNMIDLSVSENSEGEAALVESGASWAAVNTTVVEEMETTEQIISESPPSPTVNHSTERESSGNKSPSRLSIHCSNSVSVDSVSEAQQTPQSPEINPPSKPAGIYQPDLYDDSEEEEFAFVDENFDPIPHSSTNTTDVVSNSYHNAKMEAMRIAEEELEAEAAKAKGGYKTLHQISPSVRAANSGVNSMSPPARSGVKDPRFMSLADRLAEQGRKATIAPPPPRKAWDGSAAAKQSALAAVELPRMTDRQRREYSTATSSGGDEDEEIPARRVVVRAGGVVEGLGSGIGSRGRGRGTGRWRGRGRGRGMSTI